jgi:hypothetical protein
MEDAHIACLDLKTDLPAAKLSEERRTFLEGIAVFGVFDGHGGAYSLHHEQTQVSLFCI